MNFDASNNDPLFVRNQIITGDSDGRRVREIMQPFFTPPFSRDQPSVRPFACVVVRQQLLATEAQLVFHLCIFPAHWPKIKLWQIDEGWGGVSHCSCISII